MNMNDNAAAVWVVGIICLFLIIKRICRSLEIKTHGYPPSELEETKQKTEQDRIFYGDKGA